MDGKKQPYEIKPVEGCFLFAGVWDHWSDGDTQLYSCSMVTTQAVKSFEHIHKRQPVMLSQDEAKAWLDPKQDKTSLQVMMGPSLPCALEILAIDNSINNAKNKASTEAIGKVELILGGTRNNITSLKN